MSATDVYDPYAMPSGAVSDPPLTLWSALRRIGPGIILAGSIVGSGELILTTGLGAKYGFTFLGLVLFSCIIKVFVQIEMGRYAISSGLPTLGFLDQLGGPRVGLRLSATGNVPAHASAMKFGANWQVWWWLVMVLITVTQLGAMIGGVAQALNMAFPSVATWLADWAPFDSWRTWLSGTNGVGGHPEHPWAFLIAFIAVLLLVSGGYRRVETIATVLVLSITAMTVTGAIAIQWTGYAVQLSDLADGFSGKVFQLSGAAIAAAFGCFGITGVGASELYAYPYWCLEKGYARYCGPRDDSEGWVRRARGWIRVMQLDAWVSMLVFTAATLAFYFMGAAVLHPEGLDPKGPEMIRTLSEMYRRTFGDWTRNVFLLGAGAVLFKTLYVASAGHSRLTADVLSLAGITRYSRPEERVVWIRRFGVFYPMLGLALYLVFREPAAMVVIGGFIQAVTLPLLACTTIYLRHKRLDPRLKPSWISDLFLVTAAILITLVAAYAIQDWALSKVLPMLK